MKKRQMKKNQTKLFNNILSLSSQLQVLEELGVYSVMTIGHMKILECQMMYEDLIKLPFFNRQELIISNRNDSDYQYEISFEIGKFSFFCLMSRNEFIKLFPEHVEKSEDYIVVDGVRYLKEVQTNE